jgi:hypothetical protein
MPAISRRHTIALLFGVAVASLAGCGGEKKKTNIVRGKVTFNGKEVPNGTITFFPESGPTASGEIQPDGSYTLTTYKSGDGAIEGPYKVVIVAQQDQSSRLPEDRNPLPPTIVPDKYTSIATTDLRAEVKAGENTFDFHLEKEKK